MGGEVRRLALSWTVGTFGSSALDSGCFSHLSGPVTCSLGPGLWSAPVHVFLVSPHLLCPMEAGCGDMPTVTQSGQHSDPGLTHESLPRKPHAPLPPGPSLEDLPSHRWPRAENPVSGDRESRQGACG